MPRSELAKLVLRQIDLLCQTEDVIFSYDVMPASRRHTLETLSLKKTNVALRRLIFHLSLSSKVFCASEIRETNCTKKLRFGCFYSGASTAGHRSVGTEQHRLVKGHVIQSYHH